MSLFFRRINLAFSLIILVFCNASASADCGEEQIFYAEAPDWVERVDIPKIDNWEDHNTDTLLLSDFQGNLRDDIFFYREAYVLSFKDIRDDGRVSIPFFRKFREVFIHKLTICREGKEIDQLPTCRRRILCQDRNDSVIRGDCDLVFFLDDPREGDVVEVAYSIHCNHPEWPNEIDFFVRIFPSMKTEKLSYRLIIPKGDSIEVKCFGDAPLFSLQGSEDDLIEYRWEQEKVIPYEKEPNQPVWYCGDPRIQISSFTNWNEVGVYGSSFFPRVEQFEEAILEKVAQWQKDFQSTGDQILAAIRFVQDEIRYLCLHEEGIGRTPHDPSDVFIRRYGDCKDKSALLVSLCELLGVSAYPTLIHVHNGKKLTEFHPSSAFNHVIVCIEHNGEKYFIDPTDSQQGGSLEKICIPTYYYGLVLEPNCSGLTEIPIEKSGRVTTRKWCFHIDESGQKAEMEVDTTFNGAWADYVRWKTRRGEVEDFQTRLENNILRFCDGQEIVEEPCMSDDREKNEIEIQAKYQLDGLRKTQLSDEKYEVELGPVAFDKFINPKFSTERKSPLGIRFPFDVHDQILVEMESASEIEIEEKTLSYSDAYISYEIEWEQTGINSFKVHTHFQTHQDAVMPEDLESFKAGLDAFYENSSIRFTILKNE